MIIQQMTNFQLQDLILDNHFVQVTNQLNHHLKTKAKQLNHVLD
jgi:hypothetical protein